MRTIAAVLILFSLISYSSYSQERSKEVQVVVATIVFDNEEFDFGEIEMGSDGLCTFSFTNKGSEPLLLTQVNATCGCTAPSWSREPIKPNEKGEIKVKYNTNIYGPFNKAIIIDSNGTPSRVMLRIKGRVKEKPNEEISQ
jgi:hypothetical protein